MKCDVVIVDFPWVLYKSFHGYRGFSADVGGFSVNTGQLYGVTVFVQQILKRFDAPDIILCLDGSTDFRKSILPAYKANRVKNVDVYAMEDVVLSLCELLPNVIAVRSSLEADDLIASLFFRLDSSGLSSVVFTNDNDMLQLLPYGAVISNGIKSGSLLCKDANYVFDKFGVAPEHLLMFRSIVGDDSDNVPRIADRLPRKAVRSFCVHWRSSRDFDTALRLFESDGFVKVAGILRSKRLDILRNLRIMSLLRYRTVSVPYSVLSVGDGAGNLVKYKLGSFSRFVSDYVMKNGCNENKRRVVRRTGGGGKVLSL